MGNIEKFEAIAGVYDTDERAAVAKIIADKIRQTVGGADGIAGAKTAIDYGCGTGLVGLNLLDIFKTVLFADAAPNMVNQVQGKIQELQAENAKTICCDIMKNRPPDFRADCIILAQVLLHEKDTAALLSRLSDALNPGGHLIIVDFDKNPSIESEEIHCGFDQNELAARLKQTAFASVKSETFYRGDKLLMNQSASLFIMDAVKA
ncbi:MAG: class I SAM-dependent methyltransferase [Spirochaetes bacterium]|nr:class I SAM-dependent methyltransferase [Spirochaetota bacterium]